MRITVAFLLFLGLQGCGFLPASEASLSSDPQAQSSCFPQQGTQLCIPHVNRGERIFAIVNSGDATSLKNLEAHLSKNMGEVGAHANKITDGFTKAEEEARTLHPHHDLYDVSMFFPARVRSTFNRLKNFTGPNCFATSLMASGLLEEKDLLYVGPDELELYFHHYFIEVNEPRFGDVVHYDVQGSKDHTSFYLFDGLVFHKKGYRRGYGYRITELTKVFVADPFEWTPSPFDDYKANNDPSFGEKPKRYYRLRDLDSIATSPALTPQESAAVDVINHIYDQAKHSSPHWSVHNDMGIMIESAISGLITELTFLKTSPSFTAKLAYERLVSLSSQVFESIHESLFTSPRANEAKINEQYCVADTEFTRELLSKYYAYRHASPPDAAALEKMLADVRATERKSCRFKWNASW